MDYNFLKVETSTNLAKMIQVELNSIQKLTESIIFQVRQQNNAIMRRQFSIKNEGTQDSQISKLGLNEHLYKVLQSFLISLTEYINSSNKHLQSNHSLLITSPAFQSLSTVCSILWKRIQEISISEKKLNTVKQHMVLHYCGSTEGERSVTNLSKTTQTTNSCLLYCESCYLSTKLLKSLVQIILIEQSKFDVQDSLVALYRETIGANVFDLSQWGAMSGWIKAVEGDLQRAAAFLSQIVKELKKVKINQEAERKGHNIRMNNLRDTHQTVKSQLEAEQAQNGYLTLQIEHLNKKLERRMLVIEEQKKSLTEQRNQFKEVMQSMDGIKHKITQLKNSQEYIGLFVRSNFTLEMSKLSELNKSVNLSIQLIQHTANSQYNNAQRNLLEIQMNMCKKDEEINQLISRCNEANEKNMKLKENNKLLNTDLLNQKEEFTIQRHELQSIISKLESKLRSNLEEDKIKDQSNEIHQHYPYFSNDANISGNPIKDMERQRHLNKQKIRTLIHENESLKITIQKLKGVGSVRSHESSLNG